MDKEYTVIIIGAGSAGLFAANELEKHGIKTLIIEKGHHIDYRNCPMVLECHHCKSCHEVEGVGGAGGYSDGKLCNGVVGIRDEIIGENYASEVNYVNSIFKHILKDKYQDSEDNTVKNYNHEQIIYEEITEVVPLGSSKIREALNLLYQNFSNCIDQLENTIVKQVEFDIKSNKFKVETQNHACFFTKYLLIATGKCDFLLRTNLINKFGILTSQNYPSFGVRIELPNLSLQTLKYKGNNPKIKKYYSDGEYVKTHCFCYAGEVMAYLCSSYFLVGGRSDIESPTGFSNINIVYKSNSLETTQLIMKTLETISSLYPKNIIFQSIDSFLRLNEESNIEVKPCRGEIFGNINDLYPEKILTALKDFILMLKQQYNINLSGGLVHAPSAQWINPNIDVSFNMESSCKNLFFIGDTSGKTQGIIAAVVTGIRASKEIILREE